METTRNFVKPHILAPLMKLCCLNEINVNFEHTMTYRVPQLETITEFDFGDSLVFEISLKLPYCL